MKLSYTAFIEKNKELNLFDEKTATIYYRLLKMGDIQTGLSYLIDALERKFGWVEFNSSLNLIRVPINNISDTENLLRSRLDDFVVNPSIQGVLQSINGNYLLSDIVTYNILTDKFTVTKKDIVITELTFNSITQQKKIKDIILADLKININNYSLDFIIRLLIYKEFFNSFTDASVIYFKKIVNSLFNKRRYSILKESILFLNVNLYETSPIFSRLNLLKQHSVYTYNALMRNKIDSESIFKEILIMLDVFE